MIEEGKNQKTNRRHTYAEELKGEAIALAINYNNKNCKYASSFFHSQKDVNNQVILL